MRNIEKVDLPRPYLLDIDAPEVREQIQDLLLSLGDLRQQGLLTRISDAESVISLLDHNQRTVAQNILYSQPEQIGLATPPLVIEPTPSMAVVREDMTGRELHQYLPEQIAEAFLAMQGAFDADTNKEFRITSAYRSPIYQVFVLLNSLAMLHDFNVDATLKQVALPICSQHCLASATAVDVGSDDLPDNLQLTPAFADTIEYDWLRSRAPSFGFIESYPQGNPEGIAWEPWHWQYSPDIASNPY